MKFAPSMILLSMLLLRLGGAHADDVPEAPSELLRVASDEGVQWVLAELPVAYASDFLTPEESVFIARKDADGWTSNFEYVITREMAANAFLQPDGDELTIASFWQSDAGYGHCSVARFDARLRIKWWHGFSEYMCVDLAQDGFGNSWVLTTEKLLAIAPDGTIVNEWAMSANHSDRLSAIVPSSMRETVYGQYDRSSVRRYDLPTRLTARLPYLADALVEVGGELRLVEDGAAQAQGHRVVSLDPQGALRSILYIDASSSQAGSIGIVAGRQREAFVVDTTIEPEARRIVRKQSADGSMAWLRGIDGASGCGPDRPCPVRGLDDGGVVAVVQGEEGATRSVRLRADGSLERDLTLGILASRDVAIAPDGTVAAVAGTALTVGGPDGQLQTSVLQLPGAARERVDAVTATGGVSYFFGRTSDGGQFLRKVDPAGATVWRKESSARLTYTILVARHDRVCAIGVLAGEGGNTGPLQARCFAGSDGSLLYDVALVSFPRQVWLHHFTAMFTADGSLVAADSISDLGTLHVRVAPDGSSIARTPVSANPLDGVDLDANGAAAFVDRNSVIRVSADGTLGDGGRLPCEARRRTAVAILAQGGVAAAYECGTVLQIAAFDAAARPLWTTSLENNGNGSVTLHVMADSLLVLARDDTGSTLAARLDATTGQVRWQSTLDAESPLRSIVDVEQGVLLFHGIESAIRMTALRLADGQVIAQTPLDCERCEGPAAVDVSADELLLASSRGAIAHLTKHSIARLLGSVRLQQAALAGHWYTPSLSGHGIALDLLDDGSALAGAFFTSQGNTAGVAQQHWYLLQAPLSATARILEFPIVEVSGGLFASSTPVSSRRIGTARLRFESCDTGIFNFRVDGLYPIPVRRDLRLTRVRPRDMPCEGVDGTIVAPQATSDRLARQRSGFWYDTATPGQGVLLRTAADGSAEAGWLTFDPAGSVDDEQHHRWFVLAGGRQAGTDAALEFDMFQSSGGAMARSPTYNRWKVGNARLIFTQCGEARLEYGFPADSPALAFRGRQGSVDMHRIGGCRVE